MPEMQLTLKVAVMSAAGYTRQQIVQHLGAGDLEVRMCLHRLKRITEGWQ